MKQVTLAVFDLNLNKVRDIVNPLFFFVCTCITYEPTVKRLYLSGQLVQNGPWSITTLDVGTGQLYNEPLPQDVGNRLIRDVSFDSTTRTMYITAQAITMNLPSLQKGELTMYKYSYNVNDFKLSLLARNSWMAGYFSGIFPSTSYYYMYDMLGTITRIRKSDVLPVTTSTITITGPLCQTPVFNCSVSYPAVTNSRSLQPYFRVGALLDANTAVLGGDWHGTVVIVQLDKICDDTDPVCHPPCKPEHPYLAIQ